MARAVADDISKNDALNDPIRIGLGFGYALYPTEGKKRGELIAQAKTPRIRMV